MRSAPSRNHPSRAIVALDHSSAAEALRLTERLGDLCTFYKIGLGLVAKGEGIGLAGELIGQGKEVFVDLKLLDIPATVGKAAAAIDGLGGRFLTVHSQDAALKAAVAACRSTGVLSVTVLTSVGADESAEALTEKVVRLARRAERIGCEGVVCSPLEAAAVRSAVRADFKIVTPGIRSSASRDDQSRTSSARDAILAGADHIVVGRPVTAADDPVRAFSDLVASLPEGGQA